jgi:gamma-glutamyltranspeptidase/glutathione hydrolase
VFFSGKASRVRLTSSVCIFATLAASLAGCGTLGSVKRSIFGGPDPNAPKILSGFIGGAVADEPRAALAAKQVLALGGNAADAAVTLAFMLSVTLPSRASLGGGGACLVYQPGARSPNQGAPEAIVFLPGAPAQAGGDRPVAVPTMARGFYLLSARYGTRNFASLLAPAQEAARDGMSVSRALAQDLSQVAGPLAADPYAAAVFAPGGTALVEGNRLIQTDLANTMSVIGTVGVGDFYQGGLAQKMSAAIATAGGDVSVEDLRRVRPLLLPPLVQPGGADEVAFLPLPADGGLAAAAAFQVLEHSPGAYEQARAASEAAAARFRAQGGSAEALLAQPGSATPLPALPASTSFTVLDRNGGAVACALTMNNLFGTGRIAPNTGIVLAASPTSKPTPLLAAAIAWRSAFRAAVGGSGQNGAGLAVASGMAQALSGADISPVPDPGRANVISCPSYVPGGANTCRFTTDPRGAGLAAVGD